LVIKGVQRGERRRDRAKVPVRMKRGGLRKMEQPPVVVLFRGTKGERSSAVTKKSRKKTEQRGEKT